MAGCCCGHTRRRTRPGAGAAILKLVPRFVYNKQALSSTLAISPSPDTQPPAVIRGPSW
jgi:hypothetical protein